MSGGEVSCAHFNFDLLKMVPEYGTIFFMGNKHKRIFEALYEKPERNDILWDDFLALIIYLGGTIRKGGGSAHGVKLNGEYSVFHRPHPGSEIYSSDLKRIRKFLNNAGISKVE